MGKVIVMHQPKLPEFRPPGPLLPDTAYHQFRFEVPSDTIPDERYIISQHKTRRHWECTCWGYRGHKKCKHLAKLGLPPQEEPYEVNLINIYI